MKLTSQCGKYLSVNAAFIHCIIFIFHPVLVAIIQLNIKQKYRIKQIQNTNLIINILNKTHKKKKKAINTDLLHFIDLLLNLQKLLQNKSYLLGLNIILSIFMNFCVSFNFLYTRT